MAGRWRIVAAAAVLGALVAPADAFHTVFDFGVDRVTVDGNAYGSFDGVPDFVDEFDNAGLPNWYTPYGTSSVHDGRLHVTNPGRHYPGPDGTTLDLTEVASGPPYLDVSRGNFVATAVFDPIIPPEGHFYHFTLFTFGSVQFFNELFGIDINTTDGTTYIQQHMVILDLGAGKYETVNVASQPITAADLTGQLHLRLDYDAAAGTIHSSFSTDGGVTFQAPFPSVPIFTEGRNSAQLIIGADPRTGGVTTSTTITTQTTTTTTLPPGNEAVRGSRLVLRAASPSRVGTIVFRSSDGAIDLGRGFHSPDDPTINGGSLRLLSLAGGLDVTFDLPAANWHARAGSRGRAGYVYSTHQSVGPRADGPIAAVEVASGSHLVVRGAGQLDLTSDPAPLTVVLRTGQVEYCATFGGVAHFTRRRFAAHGAPRGTCPP